MGKEPGDGLKFRTLPFGKEGLKLLREGLNVSELRSLPRLGVNTVAGVVRMLLKMGVWGLLWFLGLF